MAITIEQVRDLRERTGSGVLDAKKALEATGGDMDAAAKILRDKGYAKAAKKVSREARLGRIVSYVHDDPGRIGVLLEINSETDFVARTDTFRELAKNVAMQIAATEPRWISEDDIPAETIEAEREKVRAEMAGAGKPPEIMERILTGKIDKWLDETVLMRQPYIRDDEVKVSQLVTDAIAELGENIVVRRFSRYELGK